MILYLEGLGWGRGLCSGGGPHGMYMYIIPVIHCKEQNMSALSVFLLTSSDVQINKSDKIIK